jgi:hypothetical protein
VKGQATVAEQRDVLVNLAGVPDVGGPRVDPASARRVVDHRSARCERLEVVKVRLDAFVVQLQATLGGTHLCLRELLLDSVEAIGNLDVLARAAILRGAKADGDLPT